MYSTLVKFTMMLPNIMDYFIMQLKPFHQGFRYTPRGAIANPERPVPSPPLLDQPLIITKYLPDCCHRMHDCSIYHNHDVVMVYNDACMDLSYTTVYSVLRGYFTGPQKIHGETYKLCIFFNWIRELWRKLHVATSIKSVVSQAYILSKNNHMTTS